MKYFVMLNKWNGHYGYPVALSDESEEPVLFDSPEEADQAGENNILGKAYGFEVYSWPLFSATDEQ